MKLLKSLSFHSFIFSLLFQSITPAFADEILPEDPNIHVYEKNNVNVIEIVEQNGSGLSHNKFTDYNAITKDQVINNSFSGGNSDLAGNISGNSNFNNSGSQASKILFEVKGSATMLQKDVEIFGQKADFILANSKGITCSGCGFINTSGVSFITGNVVDASNPNNIKYQINDNKNSAILINNNGITFYGDNSNDEIDFNLISRAVKIAGAVKTQNAKLKNLNIRTGAGEFKDGTKTFSNDYQNSASNNQLDDGFSVVIDSTAVGGVKAGQISIIATEKGAGVRTDDKLISDLGSAEITADGDIKVKAIDANQEIKLHSKSENIETDGKLAAENINIDSKKNLDLKQDVTAINSVNIKAADFTNYGVLSSSLGDIIINTNNATNKAIINAGNDLKIASVNNIINTNDHTSNALSAKNKVIMNAVAITNDGKINAKNVEIDSSSISISNEGDLAAQESLTVNANINNNGNITSNNLLSLNLKNSDLTNSGTIEAGNLSVTNATNIDNSGSIKAGVISLQAQNNITNNANSTIQSTVGELKLNLNGILTNNSKITAKTDLIILGNSTFTNETGKIFTAGNAIKITAKKFTNNQDLDLKGGFLLLSDQVNQGLFNNAVITSSNSDLKISGAMNNETAGILQSAANHNIILNSLNGEIVNSGIIRTDEQLRISGSLINKNIISRIDDSTPLNATDKKYLKILVNSGTLTNEVNGKIVTDNYLIIDGNNKVGNLVNLGLIRSNHLSDVNNFDDNNAIEISNINLLTNSGVIDSSEDLVISANEIINKTSGQNSGLLFASNNAILNVNKLTNDNANIITSFGDILIQKEIIETIDPSDPTKTIKSFVKSSEVNNINNAQIKTLKTAIDAPLFDEVDIRRIVEQYAIEMLSTNNFSATELTNRIYALRGFLKDSNLSIEEQIDQAITGNIKISTNNLTNNNNSIISSNNYIKIEADTINNNNDSVLASATYFDIITDNLSNQNNAQIYGATVLNIKAANEDDVNNQISNSGLIRGSAVYLNTARLTNANGQNNSNQIDSLFGKEFTSTDYSFLNNKLFVINNALDANNNSNNFLVTINKEIATTTQNTSYLTDFFSQLNIDLSDPSNASIKLIGDDIYLSQFISNLIQEKTNNRYITFDATSDTKQLTSFLDTTKAQMNKLNIEFGSELTDAQRANLTDPFIAFKQQDVFIKDGQIFNSQVLGSVKETIYIPKIITPFETTIDEETNQIASKTANAIEARNELIINATQEIRNKSDIKAGTIVIETTNFTNELDNQILTLDKDGNLKYVAKNQNSQAAKIEAKNDIFISAKENFNNIGADIKAGNALFVEGNNINISSSNINSQVALISSTNNTNINDSNLNLLTALQISSGNDVNLIGNNISSQGLIQIAAGNNLNIKTSQETTTGYFSNLGRKGGVVINSETRTNSGFNSLSAGNIVLTSKNDTNIVGASLNAINTIQIDAGNNLTIESAKDQTTTSTSSWGRKGNFTGTSTTTTTNKETATSLNANNIYLNSGNKLSVTGTNINTNDLIGTANGQISFRNNKSKVTGNLALINDEKVLNSGSPREQSSLAMTEDSSGTQDNNTDSSLRGSEASVAIQNNNLITTLDVNISSPADIVYEADSAGEDVTGNLTLMTAADIINHSSLLATGDINLSATNITNSKVQTTTTQGIWMGTIQTTTLTGAALIHAGGNVTMKANNDINNMAGTIIADSGDITLLAGNNINIGSMEERTKVDVWGKFQYHFDQITQHGSTINAGNNIVIKAGKDANITGSNLTANSNIFLNANHDVNIKSSIDSFRESGNSRKNSFSISRTTNNESNLTAGNSGSGSIYINTFNIDGNSGAISTPSSIATKDISNDVNITGSNLTAKDDVYLTANNDITIASAQDTYERIDRFKSKKRSNTTEINQTTQVSSDITAQGGNVVINSLNNDINIIASNVTAANNINVQAKENINIFSATNDYYKKVENSKKGLTTSKYSININSSQKHILSALNAGNDLTLVTTNASDATSGILIVGGKLNAGNNAALFSAGKIGIYAVADNEYSYSYSQKTRNFSKVIGFVAPGLEGLTKVLTDLRIPVSSNYSAYTNAMISNDFSSKSSLHEKQTTTYTLSEVNALNNLTIQANDDLTIVGGNLIANNGQISSINGDVNIFNVKDRSFERTETHKSKTTWSSVYAGMIQTAAASVSDAVNSMNYYQTPKQRADKTKENIQASGNIPQKTETKINIEDHETIKASNINFTNDLNINAGKDTNITSSNLTSNNGNVNVFSGTAGITSSDGKIIGSTNITSATENHYSYSFYEKKVPNIMAALSNAVVKIANDFIPSFGKKADTTQSNNDIDELVYDKAKREKTITAKTNVASNILAGNNINILSQNSNLISSSNLTAGLITTINSQGQIISTTNAAAGVGNINLTAIDGSTIITSALDEITTKTSSVDQDYNDISFEYNRGRASVNSNSKVLEEEATINELIQKSSNLNANNNINISSKENLNILSSNLSSNNQINLSSTDGNVNILALTNTRNTSTEIREGTMTLSAGVGNSHVDTAYAEYDAIQAVKAVADAKKNLNHMETLHKNGEADSDAVEDAKINLAMATLNLLLAEVKLAAAATKSAASASSLYTGFYGDIRLEIAGSKTNINENQTTAVASNILSGGNLTINSGLSLVSTNPELIAGNLGNTTITGSNLSSTSGNINVTSRNNTTINASKNTYNQSTTSKSWNESITLASSAGSGTGSTIDKMVNAMQLALGAGMSRSKSDTSSTTYNNSTLTAQNGAIKINSIGTNVSGSQIGGDTKLSGANLLGQDIVLNTQGNLTIESLQNSFNQKSKSFGLNLGGGGGSGGVSSVNGGINYSSSKTERLWVDNQTSVIGSNSVTINTGNNTEIKGALIANISNANSLANNFAAYGVNSATLKNAVDGNNLILNTNTLTITNLQDRDYYKSNGFGFSTSIGTSIDGSAANPMQMLNFYPSGPTTISANSSGYKKEQTTFATIGSGNITIGATQIFDNSNPNSANFGDFVSSTGGQNINDIINNDPSSKFAVLNRDITKSQIITKNTITAALDVSVTIDNRLLVAGYEMLTGAELTETEIKAGKKLQKDILWDEQKNLGGNLLIATNQQFLLVGEPLKALDNLPYVGKVAQNVTSPVTGFIYSFFENGSYLMTKDGATNDPTKTKNYAVNGIMTDEKAARENYLTSKDQQDVTLRYNPTHGFVGDLIESGLGKLFNLTKTSELLAMNRFVADDLHARGYIPDSTSTFHSQGTIIGTGAIQIYNNKYSHDVINPTQRFVAVGPAVLKDDWQKSVASLGINKANAGYEHDPKDPVRYLTAPSNIINQGVNLVLPDFKSPIYIPNIFEIPIGIWNGIFNMEHHDVKNPIYSESLKNSAVNNSSNPSTAPPK